MGSRRQSIIVDLGKHDGVLGSLLVRLIPSGTYSIISFAQSLRLILYA